MNVKVDSINRMDNESQKPTVKRYLVQVAVGQSSFQSVVIVETIDRIAECIVVDSDVFNDLLGMCHLWNQLTADICRYSRGDGSPPPWDYGEQSNATIADWREFHSVE